ncbi:hypothetical protein MAR_013709 [Mya arenaria]|uniref:DUF397 domain-containing protein n=1 Tax=Mya arenaria TaxID=6604 RepID=A0ABY7G198_MYAAR|nr:hypothetical protein MAR_013709 [Mya arenaria]
MTIPADQLASGVSCCFNVAEWSNFLVELKADQ